MQETDIRLLETAKNVLSVEAQAIHAIAARLDESFLKAVDIVFRSPGRVVVTGMGKSGIVARKIAATLASTGTPAFFLHPAEASHGDLGMVTEADVVIALSNSGETEELLGLLPYLKRFNVSIVSLTGNHDSTLARAADVTLDVSVDAEACPLGIVPTASTTAAMAMGDALAMTLLVKRGFKKEDFALFHPSGSLGKRLLIKVLDLMHTEDRLPVVPSGTGMIRVVMEISSKRLGLAIVSDNAGQVLGVVTDGDVRRGIERWGKDFFDMTADEAMTRGPKFIGETELAVKALTIMQRHSITSLIVPDKEGKARGVIHIHDILKSGIV